MKEIARVATNISAVCLSPLLFSAQPGHEGCWDTRDARAKALGKGSLDALTFQARAFGANAHRRPNMINCLIFKYNYCEFHRELCMSVKEI